MKKLIRFFPLAILTLLIGSGCASVKKGTNQRVDISSVPDGAAVLVNGEWVGTTPMSANLSRKRAHTVTLEKPAFNSESITVRTVPNDAANAFFRFGIDQMVGAHNDLSPSRIHAELDPLILPSELGENAVGDLAGKILEVDEQLQSGEITATEHRYILTRLIEFYQQ